VNGSPALQDLLAVGPAVVLVVGAVLVLALDLFSKRANDAGLTVLSLLSTGGALGLSLAGWGSEPREAFHQMVSIDPFARFLEVVILAGAFVSILVSYGYARERKIGSGEYYALLLFATFGMLLMAEGVDLLVIFLGLETLSISLYVLAGIRLGDVRSGEAALKYLLLGAFATGFLLYGIALLYGATGSTNLHDMLARIGQEGRPDDPMLFAGVALLVVGLGFKIASVPFHMWTPDVYEGAPTAVTGFMSVGVKAAAFAAILRIFLYGLTELTPDWSRLLSVLALLTMIVGNVVAIAQSNVKRMLAYSSIAHAGYLLVAVVSADDLGAAGALFYLAAYTATNLGAFAVVALQREETGETIDAFAGLASRKPLLAGAMALFMLSLAGIPPTAGFAGKFYIFGAALNSGHPWLAIVGVLTSVVSVYYYLRVVVVMYMKPSPEAEAFLPTAVPAAVAVFVTALLVLHLGIDPSPLYEAAKTAAAPLL
jgi:NADH-quinone oxidoreductase subunit N